MNKPEAQLEPTTEDGTTCVVVVGDLLDGFKFHGPFANSAAANAWADSHCNGYFEVRDLHRPDEPGLCDFGGS